MPKETNVNHITVTIAEELAKDLDCTIEDIDPLYEFIDISAVETLFAEDASNASLKISFDYRDRRVVVTSERNVSIEEQI